MSTTLPVNHTPATSAGRGASMTTPPPKKPLLSGTMADKLFGFLAKSAAILTLGLLFGILASLVVGAWPAITEYGLGFLTSTTWDPVKNEYGGL